MEEKQFNDKYLIEAFKTSIGLEKAIAIINTALTETGLFQNKDNLTKDEIIKVCDFLKGREKGIISIVASCLIVRISLSQILE